MRPLRIVPFDNSYPAPPGHFVNLLTSPFADQTIKTRAVFIMKVLLLCARKRSDECLSPLKLVLGFKEALLQRPVIYRNVDWIQSEHSACSNLGDPLFCPGERYKNCAGQIRVPSARATEYPYLLCLISCLWFSHDLLYHYFHCIDSSVGFCRQPSAPSKYFPLLQHAAVWTIQDPR